jgi:hypothetical protein
LRSEAPPRSEASKVFPQCGQSTSKLSPVFGAVLTRAQG